MGLVWPAMALTPAAELYTLPKAVKADGFAVQGCESALDWRLVCRMTIWVWDFPARHAGLLASTESKSCQTPDGRGLRGEPGDGGL